MDEVLTKIRNLSKLCGQVWNRIGLSLQMLIVLSKRQAPKQRAQQARSEEEAAAAEVAVRSSEWRDGHGASQPYE